MSVRLGRSTAHPVLAEPAADLERAETRAGRQGQDASGIDFLAQARPQAMTFPSAS